MIKDAPLPTRQQTNHPTREDLDRALAAYGTTCHDDGWLWCARTDHQGNEVPGGEDALADSARERVAAYRAVQQLLDVLLGGAR